MNNMHIWETNMRNTFKEIITDDSLNAGAKEEHQEVDGARPSGTRR